jgi:hypothetical protein
MGKMISHEIRIQYIYLRKGAFDTKSGYKKASRKKETAFDYYLTNSEKKTLIIVYHKPLLISFHLHQSLV